MERAKKSQLFQKKQLNFKTVQPISQENNQKQKKT